MQRVGKTVRSVFETLLEAQIANFQTMRRINDDYTPKHTNLDNLRTRDFREMDTWRNWRYWDLQRQKDEERDAIRMAFGMGAVTDKPSAN